MSSSRSISIEKVFSRVSKLQKKKDDRGGVERSIGEEGEGEVQRRRHHWRPQEARRRSDWYSRGQDSYPEVVQRLQGSYHPQGLRDSRRHGPRTLLQLGVAYYIVMDYKYMKRKAGLRFCLLKMNGVIGAVS
ncbi:unnamed protein product [Camellia sinensis]